MTTVTRDDEGSPSGMLTRNRVPSGVTSYTTFLARSRAAGVRPMVNRRFGTSATTLEARVIGTAIIERLSADA